MIDLHDLCAQHATIPALTVLQPWASAVACGAKCIETRSWQTSYRGPMAIHAGKSTWGLTDGPRLELPFDPYDQPLGAIIAVAELVECVPVTMRNGVGLLCPPGRERQEVSAQETALGDYTPGRFGWVLRNVTPITPIPWRGKQGLWRLPTSALEVQHD